MKVLLILLEFAVILGLFVNFQNDKKVQDGRINKLEYKVNEISDDTNSDYNFMQSKYYDLENKVNGASTSAK